MRESSFSWNRLVDSIEKGCDDKLIICHQSCIILQYLISFAVQRNMSILCYVSSAEAMTLARHCNQHGCTCNQICTVVALKTKTSVEQSQNCD